MADLLKFKRGTYAQLPTQLSAGTIYVTTDEGAMYVDVPNKDNTGTERIRIGETVQFANKAAFVDYTNEVAPPYSTSAFYYVVEENALLKWIEDSSSSTGGKWKQINSTSALSTSLAALTTRVDTLESNLDSVTERVGTTESDIDNLEAAVATKAAQTDLTNLTNTVSNLSSIVDTKAAQTDLTALTGRVDTAESNIATNTSDITSLKTAVGTKADNTEFQTVKTTVGDSSSGLVKKVADLEANSATKDELQTVSAKVDTNSSDIATNAEAIEAIQEAIGDGSGTGSLSARVTALEGTVGNETKGLVKDVDALETSVGTSGDDASASGSVYARIKQNAADIEANANSIDNNASAIATLETDTSGLKNKVTALETSVGSSGDDANANGSVYARIKKNAADIATNAGNIATNTGNIATNASNIAKNIKSIDDLNTDLANTNAVIGSTGDVAGASTVYGAINKNKTDIANLNTTLLEKINAANSMTYKGGVDSASGLPTTGVKVGDTYVVTNFFTMADTAKTAAYTGDMIIASGTEDTDGYITTGTLTWTVVNTGYIQEHEAKLTVANNTIALTSYTADEGTGDLGKIQLKSDNLEIFTSSDGIVTLNAVWGSFTD